MKKSNGIVSFYHKTTFIEAPPDGGIPMMEISLEPIVLAVAKFAETHGEAGVRAMAELVEKEATVEELVASGKTMEEAVVQVFGEDVDVPDIDLSPQKRKLIDVKAYSVKDIRDGLEK